MDEELFGKQITSHTLVGTGDERPLLSRGNCFSMYCSDGKSYSIVNFSHENLEGCMERGLTLPIKLKRIGERTAVVNDERIADRWYLHRWCEVCCPADLLPLPQRMAREREERRGDRERVGNMVRVRPSTAEIS